HDGPRPRARGTRPRTAVCHGHSLRSACSVARLAPRRSESTPVLWIGTSRATTLGHVRPPPGSSTPAGGAPALPPDRTAASRRAGDRQPRLATTRLARVPAVLPRRAARAAVLIAGSRVRRVLGRTNNLLPGGGLAAPTVHAPGQSHEVSVAN